MKQIAALISCLIAAALSLCSAQRSDAAASGAKPAIHEIQFRSGDITLAGTLVVPSNMVAAVVLVHGSGRRLGDVALAQELAHMGVAALAYDKRGVGKSQGIYAGPEVGTNNADPGNLDVLAGDASAAVKELTQEISSPHTPVGLLGFSQAGWIIPLTAVRTPEVKFMILWSGPLITTLEQLRFQHLTDGKANSGIITAKQKYVSTCDPTPIATCSSLRIQLIRSASSRFRACGSTAIVTFTFPSDCRSST